MKSIYINELKAFVYKNREIYGKDLKAIQSHLKELIEYEKFSN